MSDLDSIFERVTRLTKELENQTKVASEKRAEEIYSDDEYDAGSHVDPKDTNFTRKMDDILSEAVPNSPTAKEDVEEDSEGDLQDKYQLTDASSAGEGVDSDVVGDSSGEEVNEEGTSKGEEGQKLASLSDDELIERYNTAFSAFLKDVSDLFIDKKAQAVALMAKQAETDAELLFGYLMGSQMQKSAEDADSAEVNEVADVTNEAVQEVLNENPEVNQAVDELANELTDEVEKEEEQVAASTGGEVPSEETPDEMEKIIDEVVDDLADEIVAAVDEKNLDDKETEQVVNEVVEELAEELTKQLDEEEGKATDTMQESAPPTGEPVSEEDVTNLNELDNAMQEVGVSPEELESVTEGTKKSFVAKKLAAAVKNFRNSPNYEKIKRNSPKNANVRAKLKDYLYELVFQV